ncbi:MAG: hypothetical protein CME70_11055 [Halobacteriovorax sp.]|nr:hypothetical protein [Halobacteriovorax sp.]
MNVKGTDHTKEIDSLKKIEGQVRGIIKMIEDERYCIEILNQFKAVFAALGKVEGRVLEGHVGACIMNALTDDEKKAKDLIDELVAVLKETGRKK